MMATNGTSASAVGVTCPLPLAGDTRILLAHGSGGRLTYDLISEIFAAQFGNEHLSPLHDGAIVPLDGSRLAFSTDSYVVHPLFFPGGSIGELAVYGTVNDLAMCGAQPLFLSAAFLLEEGLEIDVLCRVVRSMTHAAAAAGVTIVTGDTKVVERGKADGLFITTSGVGSVPPDVDIRPQRAAPGDAILISGPIARHGLAVMSVREGLEFQGEIRSDTAPLHGLVGVMLGASKELHVLRDPTRGGIATALNEIARSASVGITIEENAIPLDEEVKAACEILGLDPLYVANEGILLAIIPSRDAEQLLDAMKQHPLGVRSAVIGTVHTDHAGTVALKTLVGTTRVLGMLTGEQLPRIC